MNKRLTLLFERYYKGDITATEEQELFAMLNDDANDEAIQELIDSTYTQETKLEVMPEEHSEMILKAILNAEKPDLKPVHRIHFLKTAWLRYAAAAIIIIGIGAYLWNIQTKEKPSGTGTTASAEAIAKADVAPGGNRATLTLADGSKIILDSAQNGTIANESNSRITKEGNEIKYDSRLTSHDSREESRLTYNTMTTPRGGQYQLTLSDGTKVWLNAASSITYPATFSERERRVTITGEAYFEVTKDKSRKFIVNVNRTHESRLTPHHETGDLAIEVLGTHFNINAYNEEPTINTTLLEGSVRLTMSTEALAKVDVSRPSSAEASAKADQKSVHTSLTLKPGQQGQLSDQKLVLAKDPDLEQVMAWKNGMFLMSNTDLPTIMRQVTRWYDIDVIYETKPSDEKFFGGISRNLPLSGILDLLKNAGVSFRLDGRKLYVRP